jgi:hypothetical protein
MATTSFTTVRRVAGITLTLLLGLCLCGTAEGQGAAPLVTASSAIGLSHPTGWGTIRDTATDSLGDWFVVDYSNGALYEFPAGGGPMIVLGPPGPAGSSGSIGQGNNPGIAIDPNNNIYLEANWNNCIVMFPYAGNNTWTGLNGGATNLTVANSTTAICTNSGKNNEAQAWAQYGLSAPAGSGFPGYFQPWGIAIGINDTILVGNQSSGNFIFSLGVNNAWTNPTAGAVTAEAINTMTARPISVAQDPEGNIYFVEEPGQSNALPGVYEIPAGTPELSSDAGLARVDPNLPAVTGVVLDAQGNLYISDSQVGVVMVPNPSGTPQTADAIVLTSVPAQGEVAFDWTRNTMYAPTSQKQTNGQGDVAQVNFGHAEFGSSAVGTAASAGANVAFGFNGSATPASFSIVEAGVTKPDFAVTGGTCTTGIAYSALQGCLENIAFTPSSVGSISANLLMLDAKNNVLASIMLHGTGLGANAQIAPGVESLIGSGLKTPSQVAVDLAGNTYVADAGLGQVLMYTAGSSTSVSIGTGLTAPTGVAVDGAGDVYIADSGNVYEVPFGPTGLNAKGQALLLSGLGSGLNLAVDGWGDLYVADPTNARVVKLSNVGASAPSNLGQNQTLLTAGFANPSAVSVDASGNLYVVDGVNLFELTGGAGVPVSLVNNLSGATGVAVDASGAVYVTSSAGTMRIPLVGGVLVPGSATTIAPDVTSSSSAAVDRWGNMYVTAATGGGITLVSVNGTLDLPTPGSLTSSSSLPATVTNSGNVALTVTGYTSSNAVDYSAADGTCVADSTSPATGIAAGATCQVVVTFDPGPGDQGTLTSQISVGSNAINSPIVINATGSGLPLTNSATAVKVSGTAQVVDAPLTVSVAAKSGSGTTPTGQVTVSFPSWTVVVPSSGPNAGIPTINPITSTMTGTLDGTGSASFQLAPVLAGSQTFTVAYSGDRVYGKSTGTMSAAVAQSAITSIGLPTFPDPTDVNLPFVPATTGNGTVPYDGTETPWQYQFKMSVNTLAGVPTGQITMMDDSSACPTGTSAAGIGTATCVLTGYKGVACPQSNGAAVITIENAGTPTGAQAQFSTACLWNVPSGTTYSPVIYTHNVTPVFSGDANFLAYNGPTATLFQSVRGPLVQITQTGNAATLTAAPTLSVSAGSSASMPLTLTSILGYGFAGANGQLNDSNFPVSLSCDIPIPHAACTFTYDNSSVSPNQVTAPNSVQIPCPTGATSTQIADGSVQCTPGQVTVTVYTNVTAGTTTSSNARVATTALAVIYGFGLLGLFFRRKAFEKSRAMFVVLLMIVGGTLAVALSACATTNLSPQTTLSSPAGTYAMNITAEEVGTQCVAQVGPGSNCLTTSGGPGVTVYASENQVSLPFYINVTVH